MEKRELTKKQAARYLLWHQGLIGAHRFIDKKGALEFIRQAGCIQFDPVDVCGKNAELTLQSRVKGFRKSDLYDLLYKDRLLLDHYDKNLSIVSVENWAALRRERQKTTAFRALLRLTIARLIYQTKAFIMGKNLGFDGGKRCNIRIFRQYRKRLSKISAR